MRKAIIGLAALLLNCSSNQYNTPQAKEALAQCLVKQEATMYGAEWCGYCRKEIKEFGSVWEILKNNYVDCSEDPQKCEDVPGYPFWKFKNGNTVRGYTPNFLEVLATESGCD